jgi:hypothetical protein
VSIVCQNNVGALKSLGNPNKSLFTVVLTLIAIIEAKAVALSHGFTY